MKMRISCLCRGQDSNYNQLEKQTNELISRRDEEIVVINYIDEKQRRNQPFVRFPSGG